MKKCLFWLIVLMIFSCNRPSPEQERRLTTTDQHFTYGAYGNFQPFVKQDLPFSHLGLDAIFTRYSSLDSILLYKINKEGVKAFVEFPLLNGKGYVEKNPEAWPILATGEKAPPADWFMGVCLTNPDFRQYREDQLIELLRNYKVDGVWLDYVHWHAQFETPDPILPETCFCAHCLDLFSQEMKVTLPEGNTSNKSQWIFSHQDGAWRLWRSHQVTNWITDFYEIIKNHDPQLRLGVYYCPWLPDEHQQAGYRILGIDITQWVDHCDVLSPMLYHERMGNQPSRIQEYLSWMEEVLPGETAIDIWPIVQAAHVNPEEYEQVLHFGMQPPSSGIQMFTVNAILEDSAMTHITQKAFHSIDQ